MIPPELVPLINAKQAAALCKVTPATIRKWVERGHLEPARTRSGEVRRDEDGRMLFEQLAVAKAEFKTRRHARRELRYSAA